MVQIARKFGHFLDAYRRPDGSRWGGQDLHDATGGVVTRSWVNVQNYTTPELRFHTLLTEDGDQRVGVARAQVEG